MDNLGSHSSTTAGTSNESLPTDLKQLDEELARLLPKAITETDDMPELERIKQKIRLLLAEQTAEA
jgi:hypothetical protein